jgi:hypothetical protein
VVDAFGDAGRPVGRLHGKMIAIFSVDDDITWPGIALQYANQVETALGNRIDDHFRLHFVERVPHSFPINPASEVSGLPVERKALADVMA